VRWVEATVERLTATHLVGETTRGPRSVQGSRPNPWAPRPALDPGWSAGAARAWCACDIEARATVMKDGARRRGRLPPPPAQPPPLPPFPPVRHSARCLRTTNVRVLCALCRFPRQAERKSFPLRRPVTPSLRSRRAGIAPSLGSEPRCLCGSKRKKNRAPKPIDSATETLALSKTQVTPRHGPESQVRPQKATLQIGFGSRILPWNSQHTFRRRPPCPSCHLLTFSPAHLLTFSPAHLLTSARAHNGFQKKCKKADPLQKPHCKSPAHTQTPVAPVGTHAKPAL
jgi:hypothetical protein